MNCKRCGNPLSPAIRECHTCGEDNGYPNVRLAARPEERTALGIRLNDAEVSTHARNCKNVLDKFGIAVLGSKAVMARSLSVMLELLESDRRTYTSYHRQLAAGSRVPEDNEFDQVRTQFEAALFPNFHEKILYGCLTLNDVGLSGYGAYAIVFKDETIAHRATVFEENPYDFCTRHKLLMNDQIPSGYRATWEERGALAKAKLHSEITPTTSDAQFPDILLNDSGRTGGNNYIEVHIFGSFNRYSIEKMIGREPKTREDRLIWRQLEELLSDIGIVAETV